MSEPIIERPTEAALLRLALAKLSLSVPSTKGMGPKDQALRLRAEMERRIKIAQDALGAHRFGDQRHE